MLTGATATNLTIEVVELKVTVLTGAPAIIETPGESELNEHDAAAGDAFHE